MFGSYYFIYVIKFQDQFKIVTSKETTKKKKEDKLWMEWD